MKITKQSANKLSINEIEKQINILNEVLNKKKEEEKILNDIFSKAEKSGINKETVINYFNKKAKSLTTKKRRYCLDVDGKKQCYGGSGKKPQWLIDYVNNGGDLKKIEVKG